MYQLTDAADKLQGFMLGVTLSICPFLQSVFTGSPFIICSGELN